MAEASFPRSNKKIYFDDDNDHNNVQHGSMAEVSFPRSSKKKSLDDASVDNKKNNTKVIEKKDELFKVSDFIPQKKKGKRKQESLDTVQPLKRRKAQTFYDAINSLDHQMITPGMVILGCIDCIEKYRIVVSLPALLFGRVSIMDISDSYTSLVQKYAENESTENSEDEVLPNLREMFTVGSYIVCKVKDVVPQDRNKPLITLTVNPKALHEDLSPSVLYNGMLLTAAVVSIEDHGYVMDVGIVGVSAFLTFDKCDIPKDDQASRLKIGQVLLCTIDMSVTKFSEEKIRVLVLNSQRNIVAQASAVVGKVNIRSLLPGTLVSAKVAQVRKKSLSIKISNCKGLVPQPYLQDPFQSLTDFECDKEVKGRILFIHPLTKDIYVSLQKHVMMLFPNSHFGGLKVGDQVNDAEVVDVIKHCLCLKLRKGVKGVAGPSQLPCKKTLIKQTFSLGSTHKCVVTKLRWMENIMMVSLKTHDLNDASFHIKKMKPGIIVQCRVNNVQPKGIGVFVSKFVRGFIPHLFSEDCYNTKVMKKLTCRVLKVNVEDALLILSDKSSLVNSKLPILSSYEDAQPNKIVEGCIICVEEGFILVSFYNNVKGIINKELCENSTTRGFTLGQVIKCMVTECVPSKAKLQLTMKIAGTSPCHSPLPAEKFPVGNIVSCEVTKIIEEGLLVEIMPSGTAALLPTMHLSDYISNCSLLKASLKPGDIIEKVVCFSSERPPIVSMKKNFIDWVESGEVISSIDSFKVGMICPLVVRNVCPYGVFVNLLHNMKALIHLKDLSEAFVADINECGFQTHQSLIGVVVSVDEVQQHVGFSIKPTQGFTIKDMDTVLYLENFLKEQNVIRSHFASCNQVEMKNLAGHLVGSVVNFTVSAISEHGVIGCVETGVKAFVTMDRIVNIKVKVGETFPSLVLAVDFEDRCLELLIDSKVIEDVVKGTESDLTELILGPRNLSCKVLLPRMECILVLVGGEHKKALGYVPFRKHFNDIPDMTNLPKYGDTLTITAVNIMERVIIGLQVTSSKTYRIRKTRGRGKRKKLYGNKDVIPKQITENLNLVPPLEQPALLESVLNNTTVSESEVKREGMVNNSRPAFFIPTSHKKMSRRKKVLRLKMKAARKSAPLIGLKDATIRESQEAKSSVTKPAAASDDSSLTISPERSTSLQGLMDTSIEGSQKDVACNLQPVAFVPELGDSRATALVTIPTKNKSKNWKRKSLKSNASPNYSTSLQSVNGSVFVGTRKAKSIEARKTSASKFKPIASTKETS